VYHNEKTSSIKNADSKEFIIKEIQHVVTQMTDGGKMSLTLLRSIFWQSLKQTSRFMGKNVYFLQSFLI
jgi:hypothetical protein